MNHSRKKERSTTSMLVGRGIIALFGLLWVFVGFSDGTSDARIPCLIVGGLFLVAAFFAGRRMVAACYFLLGLGLVVTASKGGQGHLTFGFLGCFSVAASLFFDRGWFLPLVQTGGVGAESTTQRHDERGASKMGDGRFPDLIKLSSSELEAVVSRDRARYAEAYVTAAEDILNNKATGHHVDVASLAGADNGRLFPKLIGVDRRVLLLAAGFLLFVKSFEIVYSTFSRIPIFDVAYYVLFLDTILAIKLLERKSWARASLIVLGLIGVVGRLSEYYFDGNALGAVDSFLNGLILFALIGIRTTFRRGLVLVCGYLVLATLFWQPCFFLMLPTCSTPLGAWLHPCRVPAFCEATGGIKYRSRVWDGRLFQARKLAR